MKLRRPNPFYFAISKDELHRRINNLPRWARAYIHELHSTVPSAGDVQTMADLRDQVRGLSRLVVELQGELKRKSGRSKKSSR